MPQLQAWLSIDSVQVHFPPCVTARQRAVLHHLAEETGLRHHSAGEEQARIITLGSDKQPSSQAQVRFSLACLMCLQDFIVRRQCLASVCLLDKAASTRSINYVTPVALQDVMLDQPTELSDNELCQFIQQHFHLDAASYFADHPPPSASSAAKPRAAKKHLAPPAAPAKQLTLEQFVDRTAALLDMERAAEVGQVHASFSMLVCWSGWGHLQKLSTGHQACLHVYNQADHGCMIRNRASRVPTPW